MPKKFDILDSWRILLKNPAFQLVMKDILTECRPNEASLTGSDLDRPNPHDRMLIREGERGIGIFIKDRMEDSSNA